MATVNRIQQAGSGCGAASINARDRRSPMSNVVAQALDQERERLLLTLSARLKTELESRQQRGIAVNDLISELSRIFDLIRQTLSTEAPEKVKGKQSTAAQQHGARRAEQGFDV